MSATIYEAIFIFYERGSIFILSALFFARVSMLTTSFSFFKTLRVWKLFFKVASLRTFVGGRTKQTRFTFCNFADLGCLKSVKVADKSMSQKCLCALFLCQVSSVSSQLETWSSLQQLTTLMAWIFNEPSFSTLYRICRNSESELNSAREETRF